MAGKTAAPWEVDFPESADETKVYPALGQKMAERISTLFGEKTWVLKKRAASYEAKSGEWGLQESSAKTVTLPLAATNSQIIAVTSAVAEAKVTTSGGAVIYGKWLTVASATATVVLTQDMTAFFFSDGTNWILWGEIKSEQKYVAKAFTKVEAEAGVEPSATRDAVVVLSAEGILTIGGVSLNGVANSPAGPYLIPAGQKWTSNAAQNTATLLR